jgi:hypothetical protein
MKAMIIGAALLVLAFSTDVRSAQDSTRVDRQVARLQKQLDLTTEQAAQIREIFGNQGNNGPGTKPDLRQQDIDKQIEAVLTEAQRAKYAETLNTPRRRRPGDYMAELPAQLQLTETQAVEVQKILAAAQEQRDELRAALMSKAGGPEGMREAMQKISEQTDAQLAGVLTADQLTLYRTAREEMRKNMRGRARP